MQHQRKGKKNNHSKKTVKTEQSDKNQKNYQDPKKKELREKRTNMERTKITQSSAITYSIKKSTSIKIGQPTIQKLQNNHKAVN